MKRRPFVVGIVTHRRRNHLFRLLGKLNEQVEPRLEVIINENGACELMTEDFQAFSRLKISVFRQREANIPKARNLLLRLAIRRSRWLVFIDDDCIPTNNWVATIKRFLGSRSARSCIAVQGESQNMKLDSPLAQVSSVLYQSWFHANLRGDTSSTLDTKCCAVNTDFIKKHNLFFNESLRYGSDIDLGCRLLEKSTHRIHFLEAWRVFHEERNHFLAFVFHRARLSASFHFVNKTWSRQLKVVPLSTKFNLVKSLSIPTSAKIVALVALGVAYVLSKMLLLSRHSKSFY